MNNTREQWARISPDQILSQRSEEAVRRLVQDAQQDIELLHKSNDFLQATISSLTETGRKMQAEREQLEAELRLSKRETRKRELERDTLRAQVAALQSDANSYQSGYNKGRADGTKARLSELEQERRMNADLRVEVKRLRKEYEQESRRAEVLEENCKTLAAEVERLLACSGADWQILARSKQEATHPRCT